jgi:hypothetical protein
LANYLKLSPNAPDVAQVQDQLAQLQKLMGETKQASAAKP